MTVLHRYVLRHPAIQQSSGQRPGMLVDVSKFPDGLFNVNGGNACAFDEDGSVAEETMKGTLNGHVLLSDAEAVAQARVRELESQGYVRWSEFRMEAG